jgi:hypothetical protein
MSFIILKSLKIFKDKQKNYKFFYFIIVTFIFSLIYCCFPNDEFGGLNEIQLLLDPTKEDKTSKILNKQNEIKEKNNINIKDLLKKIFLRLYYSFTVVATVGFGDIYPASIRLKAITMIQFLFTIYFIF